MPFAETSPVRILRLSKTDENGHPWSQRFLAEKIGVNPSVISRIECWRNQEWAAFLENLGRKPSKTTVEVAIRVCAGLGLIEYGSYTREELVRKIQSTLFTEESLSDRSARCARPYPEELKTERKTHLYLVTSAA